MSKRFWFFTQIVLVSLLLACRTVSSVPVTDVTDVVETAVSTPSRHTPTATPVPTASKTSTPTELPPTSPPATALPSSPTPTPSPQPPDLSITAENVILYPVPEIYAGDKVTFQILAYVPDNIRSENVTVHILVDEAEIVNGTLGGRSHLSGRPFGLFEWAWDTAELAGSYQIQVILDRDDTLFIGDENPDNNQATFTATVRDPDELPAIEANAIWKTAETSCCRVYVVSDTAADRDLPDLLVAVETAVQQATNKLREPLQNQIDVYLIDRIIGQGGYAGSSIVVSYPDRDYANSQLHQILVHETVHLLDRQFAPQRIPFLAEGLAVWASGGHYQVKDINQTAAALLEIDEFVPLEQLINNFYPIQHEIGYVQAASFVNYLIDTYGWPRFRNFYSDVTATDADTLAGGVALNLMTHYNRNLAEMESDWLAYLNELWLDRTAVIDLQTTIRYYNTMRQYQQAYDPTAYFLIAWLPYPNQVQEKGNAADLTRHPQSSINVTLEVMLQAAGEALYTGNYNRANVTLDSIERVLNNGGHFVDPFAINYWNIVQTATSMGYEVLQVTLTGDKALLIVAPANTTTLTQLNLVLSGQEWILSN